MNYTDIKLVRDQKNPGVLLKDPSDAVALLADIQDCAREKFVVIALDPRLRVTATHIVSVGTADAALIGPREVFQVPILTNASSVILAHNHPSGDPEPSEKDLLITDRLRKCGELLDIKVTDHIIIGANGKYVSFKERHLLGDSWDRPYRQERGI